MKKVLLFILPAILFASSLYLPIDNPLMDDVEKMAVIANMPTAKKPYSLKMIKIYNKRIETSHPKLYKNIDNEISRLSGTFAKERLTAGFAISDGDRAIPNSHGKDINGSYDFHAAFFFSPSDYLQASIDANAYEKDDELKIATNNSYVSLGWDYFQIDAGYRDHWFGPFKDSAMAHSTNAINSPSVTLSNPLPMILNYEFFLSRLKEQDNILYNNQLTPGSPYLAGVHLSFQLFDFLTLSANRMLQFGGGERPTGDLVDALLNPSSADNTGNNLTSDEEFGNQIGSISVQLNHQLNNYFLSIYWSMGAEDTDFTEIYYFGNPSTSLGLFLFPSEGDTSLRYEYNIQQNAWYIHHIYRDGYTNETNGMGHWSYDLKVPGDNVGSTTHFFSFKHALDPKNKLETRLRHIAIESYSPYYYKPGYDVQVIYTDSSWLDQISYSLMTGRTPLEENYISVGVEFAL